MNYYVNMGPVKYVIPNAFWVQIGIGTKGIILEAFYIEYNS